MRDIRSFIAFMLTRDVSCEDLSKVEELKIRHLKNIGSIIISILPNPNLDDSGNRDRLIKLFEKQI